jgi:hypothetical protein
MAYSPPLVQGGTFITAENVNHRQGETGINILHRAVALEALYDSADSFPQPRCHPETRTKMLDGVYNWAVGHDCTRPICWLRGPAGAGKSAVMQTLCHKLQDADRMDGAFFFKRGHSTCGNAKVLFTTLAYQLALNHRNLKLSISQSVENDPSVVGRQMDVQLPKLILEPCQSLINCRPLTLLIDGLDECQNQCSQREILRLIATAVRRYPNLFRFLIASRPEPHIREIIEDLSCEGILDSINVEQSFDDVRRYFRDEFARIHSDHWDCMGSVPTPWPSPEILDILVHESSGYFVYASTIIKFVDDRYFRPTERLAAVQNPIPILINSDSPFDALDQLYIQILSGVPTQFHSTLCDILQCAIMFDFKLKPIQLDRLLDLRPGDVQLICRGLHSILEMDSTSGISVHHASFVDFLQDPRRSSIFHPNLENRMNVTRAVVKTLSHDIRWLDNIHDPLAWHVTSIQVPASFL